MASFDIQPDLSMFVKEEKDPLKSEGPETNAALAYSEAYDEELRKEYERILKPYR